jgi:ribonuclease HI
MAKTKQKFYVVWKGTIPGIYEDWDTCKRMIHGVQGAQYKSFDLRSEAEEAFRKGHPGFSAKNTKNSPSTISKSKIITPSISVDAACSGNPGNMEYRGVYTHNHQEIFRMGPYPDGTNNIGEFLALVHALALLKNKGYPNLPIYTDSKTAISWINKKKCNTKLDATGRNEAIFDLIARAEKWLAQNKVTNPIYKWETESWGEIPADFGRK